MILSFGSLITPLVTTIGVILANQLTYGLGNRQKVWELRRQAYGVILSGLSAVERICNVADEYIEEDLTRYFDSDIFGKHNEQIHDQMNIVRERFTSDYLILSDEFIALFAEFDDALSTGAPDDDPPEEHDRFAEAVRLWRPRLLAQARQEMPLRRRRFRRVMPSR